MRLVLILAFIALPTAAPAFQMTDSAFEVHRVVDGESVSEATTTVPLSVDDETCWYWYIRSADLKGEVTFVERLELPVAPESWGDLSLADKDEVVPTRIENDGTVAISTRRAALDDGWFGHGWCLLPGDPTGPHRVEVSVDGVAVRSFDFDVVDETAPERNPTRVIRRSERSGRFSL